MKVKHLKEHLNQFSDNCDLGQFLFISLLVVLPFPASSFIDKLWYGWKSCGEAFTIWKWIMTHDIDSCKKKTFGIDFFDELYLRMNIQQWSEQ